MQVTEFKNLSIVTALIMNKFTRTFLTAQRSTKCIKSQGLSQIVFRQCSVAVEQKRPSISEDSLLQLIENQRVEPFDRKSNRISRHVEIFNANRKRELEEMLQEPDQYHPVIYNLLSAQNSEDILNVLDSIGTDLFSRDQEQDYDEDREDRYLNPTLHVIYCKAIRCAADLGEMDLCWNLFERCKSDGLTSCELYNTMMWCSMHQTRSPQALEKVFSLCRELQEISIEKEWAEHPRTYSTLLNSCAKVRSYNKALQIYRNLKTEKPEMLKNDRVLQAVIRLLTDTGDIDGAIQLIEEGDLLKYPGKYRLSYIIWTLAKRHGGIGPHDLSVVEKAEEFFRKSVTAAIKEGTPIPIGMFNSMILLYGKSGDYESCLSLLDSMVQRKHSLFPMPTASTFSNMMNALKLRDDVDSNERGKQIEYLLKVMDESKVERSWLFYLSSLNACARGSNLEIGGRLYEEMKNAVAVRVDDEIAKEVRVDEPILEAMFLIGKKHYAANPNKQEFQQFIEWIINEHSQLNLAPKPETKEQWKLAVKGLEDEETEPVSA